MMTDLLLHALRTGVVLLLLAATAHGLRSAPARLQHRVWWLGLIQLAVPAAWLAERLLPASTLETVALPEAWTLSGNELVIAPGNSGTPWPLLLWAAGTAILLLRLALAILKARRLARRSRPATHRLAEIAAAAGCDPVHVRLAAGLALPAVAGLFRPRILVPQHLAEGLPAAELRAVLRHEDAHRLRRDPLRFAAARVVRALVWWHPGAWWALHRLETTAEYACDEAAAPDPAAGERLADALARSLRLALDEPHAVLPASLAGGHVPLRRRLRRLTLNRRSPSMRTIRLLTILAVLCVGAGALLAVPAPPSPPAPVEAIAPPAAPAAVEPAAVLTREAPPAPGDKPIRKKEKPLEEPKLKPDVKPELIKIAKPEFPEEALKKGGPGTVVVLVHVDENGDVAKIYKAQPKGDEMDIRLVKAALKAAKKCKFKPALKDGKPIACSATIPFKFAKE